jgi:dTDP-4-amino-4,6-dideoxygalactose transaminase
MSLVNPHSVTRDFEKILSEYTGAPYVICIDSLSNALFLGLMYEGIEDIEVSIPSKTYPSVPCEIIHAGGKVKFIEGGFKGAYQLKPTKVWDSALRFTTDMYMPGTHMCLSFTGAHKHLKLSKGGAILTDDPKAYAWFKKARFSGRNECSYHNDDFTMLGWNFYMIPELAARGIQQMAQFYNQDGSKKDNPDIELSYPDLSKYPVYVL